MKTPSGRQKWTQWCFKVPITACLKIISNLYRICRSFLLLTWAKYKPGYVWPPTTPQSLLWEGSRHLDREKGTEQNRYFRERWADTHKNPRCSLQRAIIRLFLWAYWSSKIVLHLSWWTDCNWRWKNANKDVIFNVIVSQQLDTEACHSVKNRCGTRTTESRG